MLTYSLIIFPVSFSGPSLCRSQAVGDKAKQVGQRTVSHFLHRRYSVPHWCHRPPRIPFHTAHAALRAISPLLPSTPTNVDVQKPSEQQNYIRTTAYNSVSC
jgi:hypothetical protein